MAYKHDYDKILTRLTIILAKLNDGNCYNTTSAFQKNRDLNSQKHCWLLHSLYDHNPLDWDEIFKIDSVYFDVKIQYEYAINISI